MPSLSSMSSMSSRSSSRSSSPCWRFLRNTLTPLSWSSDQSDPSARRRSGPAKPPVDPCPPSPRAEPGSSSTSWNRARSTRWTTSWAIRSPRRSRTVSRAVVVDEQHLDLAAVAGVDRAGRVDHPDAELVRQSRARVHERRVPGRQRDRHPGRHHRPLARLQHHVLGGHQVGAGVAGMGVRRQRQVGVEPAHEHLDRPARACRVIPGGHGGRPYASSQRRPPAVVAQPANSVRSTSPIGSRPDPAAWSWKSRSEPRASSSQRCRIRAISRAPVRYDDAWVGHAQ